MCWTFKNMSFYFQNAMIFILIELHITQSFSSTSLDDILPGYAYYHHSNWTPSFTQSYKHLPFLSSFFLLLRKNLYEKGVTLQELLYAVHSNNWYISPDSLNLREADFNFIFIYMINNYFFYKLPIFCDCF